MSLEISSDILAVGEECRWKFPATLKLCDKNGFGHFQRHFGCGRKMSEEISSDILTVREKCRWKFHSIFNSFFFSFTKHLARYMEISTYLAMSFLARKFHVPYNEIYGNAFPCTKHMAKCMEIYLVIHINKHFLLMINCSSKSWGM